MALDGKNKEYFGIKMITFLVLTTDVTQIHCALACIIIFWNNHLSKLSGQDVTKSSLKQQKPSLINLHFSWAQHVIKRGVHSLPLELIGTAQKSMEDLHDDEQTWTLESERQRWYLEYEHVYSNSPQYSYIYLGIILHVWSAKIK